MPLFKNEFIENDFNSNPLVKLKIKEIANKLDNFCVANKIPRPIITDLLRASSKSQHSCGEAFDMRLIDFDGSKFTDRYNLLQFSMILDFLEVNFPRMDKVGNRRARTAYAHVGTALHLHVSIDKT